MNPSSSQYRFWIYLLASLGALKGNARIACAMICTWSAAAQLPLFGQLYPFLIAQQEPRLP
jgi:hypothetical protein